MEIALTIVLVFAFLGGLIYLWDKRKRKKAGHVPGNAETINPPSHDGK